MCKLIEKAKEKSAIVYKIAAKRNGEYYSLATSIKYDDKKIKIPDHFTPIDREYINVLNKSAGAYHSEMVGRTAAFLYEGDALIEINLIDYTQVKKGYSVCVLKVKLTDDLMYGLYSGCQIIAGRKLQILEEIKCQKRHKRKRNK